ncbi:hypothetical protein ACXR2T_10135 [Leucobacter sp. HY1910]
MSVIEQAIGFIAAVVSFVLFLPQAQRAWQFRRDAQSLRGISVGTQLLVLLNASLWGAYAFITGSFWVGAPGLVNAPLAMAMIVLILRSRRQAATEDECLLCRAGAVHEVFVTVPPGWGSVVPCTAENRKNGIPTTALQQKQLRHGAGV